ncbi:23S rRNA (adenine(2503)-C(2))-methyltransferase RlmN [Desulfosporosinus sp.]|uniref:23S rRNA (adenine(2503)-C(2))-methyltransferase RlmN n=1 Tax=Desulfosporosinus sp. TaxID=157907 RepID=UPI000E8B7A92|nr:23S rRNA (adenine(2503)-C(2))-methyltransferase RlmN [Desulfosporosinus sp.]MBC2723913.1 23S rRNA (adenine(2503)-C(2))-methyltransferase RlmN [Desulfosporosinus sp.]MBC2725496.1 23S rRNA (adenine(2503)-C(2))-methyltransferase RlmN [Desulfosporosinus sp.]HBV88880.1 23S rRNA (adenine(2503)-C(2))-methyltransferase RlmN [Desulfosporosinus sp.]
MKKESIYELTLEQLIEWLMLHGHKKSRALNVWDWLYRKRVTKFSVMTDVNHDCLNLLEDHFVIQTLCEHIKQESTDGTIKYLFKLQDDHLIETVLMKHKFGLSVCVTTQVGCNIGCSFCASGLMIKQRDLSSGEIVEQIMKVQQDMDKANHGDIVSHVVVMGIGEPFDNYDHVANALRIIKDHKGLSIPGRHITISTSGLVEKIYEFADSDLKVNLAISLHAPTNELREQIMKINRVYPIESLIQAIEYYLAKTNRRITLEYILIKDLNDHKEHAWQLANLIKSVKPLVNVNLIPYNPVDEHQQYQRSDHATMLAFYDILKKQRINCSIRLEHGRDIDAACGQLRSKQVKAHQD